MPPPLAPQDRVNRVRAFRDELAELDRAGVLELTPEQLGAIDRHHSTLVSSLSAQFDVDVTDTERQLSLGMRIAALLGAAALAAAVVLFAYRIWGLLGPAARVAALTSAPLAGLGVTALAARLDRSRYFASIAAVTALAAFVADLQSMQDAFALTPSPHVFGAWALFGALLAYAFGLRLVFAGAILCVVAWIAAALGALAGGPYADAFSAPEHVAAGGVVAFTAGWLPLHRRLGLSAVCRGLGGSVFLLMLVVLTVEGGSLLPISRGTAETLYQVLGPLAAATLILAGIRRGWSETPIIATIALSLMILLRFADWWWDRLPHYVFFLLVGALAVATLVVLRLVRRRPGATA